MPSEDIGSWSTEELLEGVQNLVNVLWSRLPFDANADQSKYEPQIILDTLRQRITTPGMRRFGEVGTKELAKYEGGEFFVHYSPRSFKKGIVGQFIPTGEGTYRVTTTGFSEPHDTKRFGYWQPTGDKCRYVEIGVELPVFDLSWGTMVVVDEQKGILYEFIPWGTVGCEAGP